MKKLATLIIIMTLCLSIVQFGFDSTYVNADGSRFEPIGTASIIVESE